MYQFHPLQIGKNHPFQLTKGISEFYKYTQIITLYNMGWRQRDPSDLFPSSTNSFANISK